MEYKEFKEQLLKLVQEQLAGRYEVTLEKVMKNNGREREGLKLLPLQGQRDVSPVIYLEELYWEGMEEGELEACAERLIGRYIEGTEGIDERRIKEQITDWEQAREKVYPILLSAEKNRQLLEELPFRPMLDLAIVYLIRLELEKEGERGAAKVTNNLLELWEITEEELYEKAMENLVAEPPLYEDLEELLGLILQPEGEPAADRLGLGKLHVLTNQERWYGASMMLNGPYLKEIAEGRNLFILPSSIHETLLLVDDGSCKGEDLNEMVRAVNRESVAEEERLQEHVYYYEYEKGEIRFCA